MSAQSPSLVLFASRVVRQLVAPSVYCPVPSLPAGPSRRTFILSLEDLNIKHQYYEEIVNTNDDSKLTLHYIPRIT